MISEIVRGLDIGLTDAAGKQIHVGDKIRTVDHNVSGRVCFGIYDNKHYGFYIEWENGYKGSDHFRQDIVFWSSRVLVDTGNQGAEKEDLK